MSVHNPSDPETRQAAKTLTWEECVDCSLLRQSPPSEKMWCPDCGEIHGGDS